jgi:hypothetical protein
MAYKRALCRECPKPWPNVIDNRDSEQIFIGGYRRNDPDSFTWISAMDARGHGKTGRLFFLGERKQVFFVPGIGI